MRLHEYGLAASILLLASRPALAVPPCADLLPDRASGTPMMRSITASDLARLRDIGATSNANIAQAIFSLSPDGRRIAFPIRRGEPDSNTYCMGMFVADVRPDTVPVQVDAGGRYILYLFSIAGFVESSSSGTSEVTTPLWSPDGQWIAFLRQDAGFPQIWRAKADGSVSEQVTHANFAVKTFAWTADGKTIVYSGKPALEVARAALPAEGNQGFLYDDRFMPVAGNWPRIREPIPTDYFTVDPSTGKFWPASKVERAVLVPAKMGPLDAVLYQAGPAERQAWTSKPIKTSSGFYTALHALANGHEAVWNTAIGQSIDQLWWTPGKSLVFLTHEATRGSIALYVWNITDQPRVVLADDDVLIGCQLANDSLICGRERSTQPRRLVRVDLKTGRQETIFDPNPEFAALKFGPVRRLYWKNKLGFDAYGDLVLPPDHRAGQKHPLVVVQYTSKGFLRGGTGDEFPVQALAAQGFAVLNFSRPPGFGARLGFKDAKSSNRADVEGWADRASVQSSLDAGLDAAIATGAVDPNRIGITGLSDGSSTVQYALVHSHRFKAAAMATCCDEATNIDWLDGPAGGALLRDYGFPAQGTEDHDSRWAGMSLAANASEVTTPLLMQLPDHEYLAGLESYSALRAAKKPVEAYVFPDEYHVKWQPAHRLASYQRSIDWFRFWLMDAKDPSPGKAAQYARWDALAKLTSNSTNASPGP